MQGEMKNAYSNLVGNSEERTPRGRLIHRQEVNIKVDLKEMGYV
jgi:hypothetical protein